MILNLSNIGIIEKSEIKLEGLTVIAGENDTGKSTVGKVLFCLIKALNKPEELEVGLSGEIKLLHDFLRRAQYVVKKNSNEMLLEEITRFRRDISKLNFKSHRESLSSNDSNFFESLVENLSFFMEDITSEISDFPREILDSWDEINFKINTKTDITLEAIRRAFFSEFNLDINNKNSSEKGSIKCSNNYEKPLISLTFEGKKIYQTLSEDTISYNDVVFIESPIILNLYSALIRADTNFEKLNPSNRSYAGARGVIPYHIKDLIGKLEISKVKEEYSSKIDDEDEIKNTISGKISFSNDYNDFIFENSKNNVNHIHRILNTASGIKSFGILQLLEKGGFLNKETLLIIDEPEVHLHPKWQLKYAEIIIRLVKIGIPVLVTSHSPYFVQALKVYSDKEELTKKTHFYLSENGDNGTILEDVSSDLNKIFLKLAEPFKELVWRKN